MEFPRRLRELRLRRNLSQVELGKALSLDKSTISLYESGRRQPDYATLERLADFFGVSTDFLIGRAIEDADRLMSAARRLIAVRQSRGITQRELAVRLGVDVTEVARYESAVTPLPEEVIDRLADIFGVDRRYFTGEIGQQEIQALLGETWFRAPAELPPEARRSVEDFIAFVIAQEERKKQQEKRQGQQQ